MLLWLWSTLSSVGEISFGKNGSFSTSLFASFSRIQLAFGSSPVYPPEVEHSSWKVIFPIGNESSKHHFSRARLPFGGVYTSRLNRHARHRHHVLAWRYHDLQSLLQSNRRFFLRSQGLSHDIKYCNYVYIYHIICINIYIYLQLLTLWPEVIVFTAIAIYFGFFSPSFCFNQPSRNLRVQTPRGSTSRVPWILLGWSVMPTQSSEVPNQTFTMGRPQNFFAQGNNGEEKFPTSSFTKQMGFVWMFF